MKGDQEILTVEVRITAYGNDTDFIVRQITKVISDTNGASIFKLTRMPIRFEFADPPTPNQPPRGEDK